MAPLVLYLLGINLITLLVLGYDKFSSMKNSSRVSEINLLLGVFLGGTLGGILGIVLFRHKISKGFFLLKFFGVAILQLIILRFILRILWQ
ncbi:DUF1294 domain-containing protein [Flavobacterium sp.]|jgi:uncharacterized membrane protein YsdA (DUF1294 family)|uniref:DUF1294 domain-containing protein n=1 Tax=Flavobacterium sp. TaxID=239 RepID=UPI0037BF64C0